MRIALVFCMCALLLPGLAYAEEPRSCPDYASPTRGSGHVAGFEADFPPDGWMHIITNPDNTWGQSVLGVHEGTYCAYIPWQAGVPQEEWLTFQYVPRTDDFLRFATMGSTYWTQYANFEVWVDGAIAWDFYNDFPGASWTYEVIQLDLSAHVGQLIEIGFRYVGNDGADIHLDMVDLLSYDQSVEDLQLVWSGRGEFALQADLGASSHGSHDPVATAYTFEIDGVPVQTVPWDWSVFFCGDCYIQFYPDCWYGWCPDFGQYSGQCDSEYIGAGFYRCRCHWSKPADSPFFPYTGQQFATVSIAVDTEIIETDYGNNTMTIEIIPLTPVEASSWTVIKGLYR